MHPADNERVSQLTDSFQKNPRRFAPYITKIRFPNYKAISPDASIAFRSPITCLVGPNGTNKSSVLHALYGAPGDHSPSRYWFATPVDPIGGPQARTSNAQRFIYDYSIPKKETLGEVRKMRTARKYPDKVPAELKGLNDPDYWETTKQVKTDGMREIPASGFDDYLTKARSRWSPVEKPVVYLDFRSEVSPFDKYMYHTAFSRWAPDDVSKRYRMVPMAKKLKRVLTRPAGRPLTASLKKSLHEAPSDLPAETVAAIGRIIGRNYTRIQLVEHSIFGPRGHTAVMTEGSQEYSEAHAGSGEFAVVRLVTEVQNAPERSLILLDEPEVSLHPGAQVRLIEFIAEVATKRAHQVVISTHSPIIVDLLPSESLVSLQRLPGTAMVDIRQDVDRLDIFENIGAPTSPDVHIFYVEDQLARAIANRAVLLHCEDQARKIDIQVLPGGCGAMLDHAAATYAITGESRRHLLLDGDVPLHPEDLTDLRTLDTSNTSFESRAEYVAWWKEHVQGSSPDVFGGSNADEAVARWRSYLAWVRENVHFIPGKQPEALLLEMVGDETVPSASDHKGTWVERTRRELDSREGEQVTGQDILQTQRRALAKVQAGNPHLRLIASIIASHLI